MKLVTRNFNPYHFGNTVIDNLFKEDFFRPSFSRNHDHIASFPATNIINSTDQYLVELAVPGYLKSDFSIEIDKGVLTVSAQNKEIDDTDTANYSLRQFKKTAFKRSFRIAEDKFDTEALVAHYEAGVLSVVLPKKEDVDTKLKIEVL
jgi:HSP20 family protein